MSVTITPDLQAFINKCKSINKINDILVEELTDIIKLQITSKDYTLSKDPTWFKFLVQDYLGGVQRVNVIVPYEIWSNPNTATGAAEHLYLQADRYADMGDHCELDTCIFCNSTHAEYLLFLRPDTQRVVTLCGREMDPISYPSENLEILKKKIEENPRFSKVTVHNIVEPSILEQMGEDAVMFYCIVPDLQYSHFGFYNLIVSKVQYESIEEHDNIIKLIP